MEIVKNLLFAKKGLFFLKRTRRGEAPASASPKPSKNNPQIGLYIFRKKLDISKGFAFFVKKGLSSLKKDEEM